MRAEDAQETPTQSHKSPSMLVYEDYVPHSLDSGGIWGLGFGFLWGLGVSLGFGGFFGVLGFIWGLGML